MMMMNSSYLKSNKSLLFFGCLCFSTITTLCAQDFSRISNLKETVANWVNDHEKLSQVMVDKVFSFSELGFQEEESSNYLTGILKKEGFSIEYGVSGIPTAWVAKWSNGAGPVIALGSDRLYS